MRFREFLSCEYSQESKPFRGNGQRRFASARSGDGSRRGGKPVARVPETVARHEVPEREGNGPIRWRK